MCRRAACVDMPAQPLSAHPSPHACFLSCVFPNLHIAPQLHPAPAPFTMCVKRCLDMPGTLAGWLGAVVDLSALASAHYTAAHVDRWRHRHVRGKGTCSRLRGAERGPKHHTASGTASYRGCRLATAPIHLPQAAHARNCARQAPLQRARTGRQRAGRCATSAPDSGRIQLLVHHWVQR